MPRRHLPPARCRSSRGRGRSIGQAMIREHVRGDAEHERRAVSRSVCCPPRAAGGRIPPESQVVELPALCGDVSPDSGADRARSFRRRWSPSEAISTVCVMKRRSFGLCLTPENVEYKFSRENPTYIGNRIEMVLRSANAMGPPGADPVLSAWGENWNVRASVGRSCPRFGSFRCACAYRRGPPKPSTSISRPNRSRMP